jgi:threonine dehydrogenase-like Zn-dependent dehydrogenase
MKALVWHGKGDIRCDDVPDPKIEQPTDAIVRITSTAICGSDLHLMDGYVPTMMKGDVLGHEPMGVVVETGPQVTKIKKGDRVIVPFPIACGSCWFCNHGFTSCCDNSNPEGNREIARKLMGHAPAAIYGYSHMLGGIPGGQAEYLRTPYADANLYKVTSDLPDDKVLFMSDILPTGYMAAENAEIQPGDTVAVWGCGPVGQFSILSAWLLGAGRVIAIDHVPERLELARRFGKAETINFKDEDVYDKLMSMTDERGPDRAIDAVGCENHITGGIDAFLDAAKHAVMLTTDRVHSLRQAIYSVRKAGTVWVPGVYVGFPDKFPMGAVVNKGLTIKSGQTHVHRYFKTLMPRIESGEIDPSAIITHRINKSQGPEHYFKFRDKLDGCIKVVINSF